MRACLKKEGTLKSDSYKKVTHEVSYEKDSTKKISSPKSKP